jgi:ketosteroid isomerase-like protein
MSTSTLNASVCADEAEILALCADLHKAHLNKDPEGIAAPFAPRAVIYDLEPPLSHDGISVGRKRKWLATWDTPIELTAENFKVVVSGDHAYGYGYERLSGTKKGAGPSASGCG